MTTRYSSFLIRCWQLAGGARRIVVEHIQTGDQVVVPTVDAATAWIGGWESDACDAAATTVTNTPAPLPSISD